MKEKNILFLNECCDVLFLNECHIASAKQIVAPALIPAKINRDKMKSLYLFTKNKRNTPFSYHTLLFYVYAAKLAISVGIEL